MQYVLILLGVMFANVANAMDCEKVPDCESLGYSTKDDPNCANDGYMYCPFDQDYKVCVQYNCAALGFTESDKTSWCADLIKCKGNEKMTLCQKPCFATNYTSLKELAESGDCKVTTVQGDITIPENQSVTLAENTVIDGGGHTLYTSGNQKDLTVFSMGNNTGLKNLKLKHTQKETQDGYSLLFSLAPDDVISLENVDITVNSDNVEDVRAPVIGNGIYNIHGKFALTLDSRIRLIAFQFNTMNFTDAQVSIITQGTETGNADMAEGSTLTFTNSTVEVSVDGSTFTKNGTATFINSQANISAAALFFGDTTENHEIFLDKSSLTSKTTYRISNHIQKSITLKGTGEQPSILEMTYNKPDTDVPTNIVATNTTDKVILNGITYRPKQAGMTKLSEIGSSKNWEKVLQ